MIIIEIGFYRALINNYKWTSDNNNLERMLNTYLDPTGTSPSDPNPDLTEAQKIIEKFGGKIIKQDEVIFKPNSEVQY